ncbi:MAG: HAD family phosphatase [Acidobacteriaceae bacterium]|jgi:putative hydrolase of the HAD superfamily
MPFPYLENPTPADAGPASRIHAVLFDYGQVLSGPLDPVAWARIRAITGLDEARLHDAYWKFRHDYDRDALTGPTYWHAVAAHAGITLNATQLAALLAADIDLWASLNPPMVEWASRLQRAGIHTAILSNIGDCMAQGIVARFPWLAGFDQCIWSYALHMAKPEPAIFLKTAEAIGAAPANILFLDDRAENVAAAVALGFQTILYKYADHAAFEREMRRRGFTSLLDAGASPSIAETALVQE